MRTSRVFQRAAFPPLAITCLLITPGAIAIAQQDGIEQIYVARSVRESRVTPTDFCAESRTGFPGATVEDRYAFRSIVVRTSDARVTDAGVSPVATGHACMGPTADPAVLNFYMEATFAGVSFKGRGDCRAGRADYPEAGVQPFRCYLDIRDLPAGYVGGQLTSNTVFSRATIGPTSDPAGYTQPSIAVVRLWKRRQ